jgi:hypothetical protein
MTAQEQAIFDALAGRGIQSFKVTNGIERDMMGGILVELTVENLPYDPEFFFPDEAETSDELIIQVISRHIGLVDNDDQ